MLSQAEVTDIMRELLMVCIQIAAPVLLVSIVVGLIIAIFQAATQIHEQTLTFVPKLLVIALMLVLLSSFIYATISDFTLGIFDLMATL